MSGPKVIDYRALERERVEASRRRWRSLCGWSSALERRAASAGHLDCVVDVVAVTGLAEPTGGSEAMKSQCDKLEQALARAASELERRQLAERAQQVMAGMRDILADVERRERAATEAAAARRAAHPAAPLEHSTPRVDYADKVAAKLASLKVPSAELERAAREVLATVDQARARVLYADLAARIEEANRRAERIEAQRTEIAELRAHLNDLPDPDPVSVLLDQAAIGADRGDDVHMLLTQARGAITHQLDRVAAQANREFVRQAVVESLTELGYDVLDVAVQTPQTLVVRQSGTHGVRAEIGDGEIGLRAVRFGPADAVADRDAEEEFCRRVPGLLGAMSRRGLSTGIREQKLPGLFAPEAISLRKKATQSSSRLDEQHTTHQRGTR
ncbi:hypothetical protein BST27_00945 [Mycobacterium intermedium]|uniref:Uncharacterized protein n=1 Tax=Mycobacterium intermedium TaxID=28445 RepID=A0A1E3SFY6_MYCIE|nr:hypothetical protein [Mycobacterium intermedium]MCV6963669.1 hypothetical protein [Mycobacterium intermedium]ODR01041.1 hypothetical protein BHQ20_10115 [Mycobacterium intermedium]OPE52442.1 hypothetical protein BV508_02440 [Mycobacterium intermedium]ORB10456.1 hypothetical protein BST27_00945 [Mycobacterium intermedium]